MTKPSKRLSTKSSVSRTETVEEYMARGGKVKVRKMSAELTRKIRENIKGDSRFSFHQTKKGNPFE